jgi:hypothetical protein
MGSCWRARGRKMLRSLFLKLFSRDLAFMVISNTPNAIGLPPCHHQAVVGFMDASFGGGRKGGGERRRLLNWGQRLK